MTIRKVRLDRQRLEALMALRGFTNETLAQAMGKHYNSIIRIKQEQSTTFDTIELLCQHLTCHPFDLIVAEGYPAPFLASPASL